jgi:alkylation response protein AidB-like acyl-CoA dehydrogenase
LVDTDTPGVVREPAYEILGGHALGACGFRFESCKVSNADLLVGPEVGFKAAMAGIDIARASVAAMCAGMLRTSLNTALQTSRTRSAFGKTLDQFQGLQWQLADVATDRHAARLMAYEACGKIDRGEDAALDAAHAKKFATRAALSGISECMQAMGANGLKHEYPLARLLACAKIAQYLDGSTEIQNVVISRALQRGPVL